ncbi:EsaB/YukD family protein [Leucobacter triazinivorans]|uniref:Type VII secretion integral membrane protein EccD n=1 Tax=Leucobacter triazinivorans TaxID=1784719 RepID=A0A4V0Z1S0_9MICO|nr:EsaB/YukD family protein [Leucobacter triazinivorans]QBE49379.1 type VII secretion integral membrane protein EccD [Leucobacter triazinivorans]
MSPEAADQSAVVRLSVVHAERRIDLAVPGRLPLLEVLPGVARGLGVLDATLLHGGYRLTRADGTELDPARGAIAQGIGHGEILTLTRGQLIAVPRRYDDVVEAVIDATSAHHAAWRPEDAARTATAVSLTLVALSAILLALQPADSFIPAVVAGTGLLVLLALTATLGRIRQREAGIAFGIAAAGFAGLTGALLVRDQPLWGFTLAAAGAGLAIGGAAAMLLAARPVELLALPIALGVAIALPASVVGITGVAPEGPFSVMVACAGLLAGALPWLTLSSTRIRVVSPSTEAEMFDPPPPIDPDAVAARVDSGHRLLVALRIACAIAVLTATPVVAASSWIGTALTITCGTVLMFQSRQSVRRASVLVLLAGGTAILGVSGLTAILAHREQAPVLLAALLIATGLVTGLTLLSARARMRLSTLGDTVEVVLLAALLPLGALAAGIA